MILSYEVHIIIIKLGEHLIVHRIYMTGSLEGYTFSSAKHYLLLLWTAHQEFITILDSSSIMWYFFG
jgi:hypothetical protein